MDPSHYADAQAFRANFKDIRTLGAGASGSVALVQHSFTLTKCALKRIKPTTTNSSDARRQSIDDVVSEVATEIKMAGIAEEGDPFVIVCGKTFGRGATNQIKVEYVKSSYWDDSAKGGVSDMSANQRGRNRSGSGGGAHKGCTIC